MSAHRVSLLDAIGEYSTIPAISTYRILVSLCILVATAHVACACILYGSIHSWDALAWTPSEYWTAVPKPSSFCSVCEYLSMRAAAGQLTTNASAADEGRCFHDGRCGLRCCKLGQCLNPASLGCSRHPFWPSGRQGRHYLRSRRSRYAYGYVGYTENRDSFVCATK